MRTLHDVIYAERYCSKMENKNKHKGIFAIHAKKLVTVTLHKPIITLSKFQNATYRIRPAVLLLVIVRSKKKWPEQIGNFRSHMQYSLWSAHHCLKDIGENV